MDDTLFDAIAVLCDAAEQEGYVSVADALELCLDVYLLEREQRLVPEPIFRSARHADRQQIAEWTADRDAPDAPPGVGWSMSAFPMLQVG